MSYQDCCFFRNCINPSTQQFDRFVKGKINTYPAVPNHPEAIPVCSACCVGKGRFNELINQVQRATGLEVVRESDMGNKLGARIGSGRDTIQVNLDAGKIYVTPTTQDPSSLKKPLSSYSRVLTSIYQAGIDEPKTLLTPAGEYALDPNNLSDIKSKQINKKNRNF
jgi:hypothetical protein